MLGDKIDQQVQDNITATRANVGIINTTIISSIRNAALLSQDKSRHISWRGRVFDPVLGGIGNAQNGTCQTSWMLNDES